MKLQMTPVFGALVVGTGGIAVTYANGTYTFSLEGAEPIQVTVDSAIAAETTAVAVVRNNPVTTNLLLPALAAQKGKPLSIFDFSTNVVNHAIVLTPAAGQTIMPPAPCSIGSSSTPAIESPPSWRRRSRSPRQSIWHVSRFRPSGHR